ncbi:MAG: MFS transporter [Armatimonadota bacterium]|nr:MFS transporter [Armatimonadota bacterium]
MTPDDNRVETREERSATTSSPSPRKVFGVSHTVFTLGIVSFLTDVSSEMLVPIIPQFLKFVIGTSALNIGLIEGIAESTASILRVWAGYLADKFGRPKLLTVLGYGLSAMSKPFFIFANSWSDVLGIRFADRFGKGIRSAPRDVLIADATEESARGRAFGFHRAMDTAGATLGPLVVLILVWLLTGGHLPDQLGKENRNIYTWIFAAAAIPAVLGWLVLVLFVREKKHDDGTAKKPELKLSALDKRFKVFLLIVTLFSIGNSSDAFLVLRATSDPIGMAPIAFLLVYVIFNAISAVVSLRSGIVSDKIGRKPVVVTGWLVFSLVYFAMSRVTSPAGITVWFIIYGVYYGMTEGILRAYAVDLAPAHLRGTAIGAYYTFTGVALLPASLIAGFLWDNVGPSGPFIYGAATSAAAAILLLLFVRNHRFVSGEEGVEG